ncbi:hypothetical protein ACF3MZ_24390 [Paenibacillaceae bacterium WGS1546]
MDELENFFSGIDGLLAALKQSMYEAEEYMRELEADMNDYYDMLDDMDWR